MRRLQGHVSPQAVVQCPRTHASLRQLDRLGGDDRHVADPNPRTGIVAVARSDVDVQVADLGHLLALLLAQQVNRLLAHRAGHVALARPDHDPLADEDLSIPASDGAKPQEPVVVDVGEDQPDLVDVPHDGQARAVRRAGDARRAGPDNVARHVQAGFAAAREPDVGGGGLVARGAGGFQQVAQEAGNRHGGGG